MISRNNALYLIILLVFSSTLSTQHLSGVSWLPGRKTALAAGALTAADLLGLWLIDQQRVGAEKEYINLVAKLDTVIKNKSGTHQARFLRMLIDDEKERITSLKEWKTKLKYLLFPLAAATTVSGINHYFTPKQSGNNNTDTSGATGGSGTLKRTTIQTGRPTPTDIKPYTGDIVKRFRSGAMGSKYIEMPITDKTISLSEFLQKYQNIPFEPRHYFKTESETEDYKNNKDPNKAPLLFDQEKQKYYIEKEPYSYAQEKPKLFLEDWEYNANGWPEAPNNEQYRRKGERNREESELLDYYITVGADEYYPAPGDGSCFFHSIAMGEGEGRNQVDMRIEMGQARGWGGSAVAGRYTQANNRPIIALAPIGYNTEQNKMIYRMVWKTETTPQYSRIPLIISHQLNPKTIRETQDLGLGLPDNAGFHFDLLKPSNTPFASRIARKVLSHNQRRLFLKKREAAKTIQHARPKYRKAARKAARIAALKELIQNAQTYKELSRLVRAVHELKDKQIVPDLLNEIDTREQKLKGNL